MKWFLDRWRWGIPIFFALLIFVLWIIEHAVMGNHNPASLSAQPNPVPTVSTHSESPSTSAHPHVTFSSIQAKILKLDENFQFKELLQYVMSLSPSSYAQVQKSAFTQDVNDAQLLMFLSVNLSKWNDKVPAPSITNSIGQMNLPQNALIAFLQMPELLREQVIYNRNSLSPFLNGNGIVITNVQKLSANNPVVIGASFTGFKNFYEVDFTTMGNQMQAYVVQNNQNQMIVDSIQNVGIPSLEYYTVSQWEQIELNQAEGKPLFQGIKMNPVDYNKWNQYHPSK
jgi:hypothetical protein